MTKLGVNIDHIATIRQARLAPEPDPVAAAVLAELGGADGITVHLRQDRRHIQDRDIRLLRQTLTTRLNIEMATVEEMLSIALETRPETVTLVPEREDEVTTEGGLDVVRNSSQIAQAADRLVRADIEVSLFVDPDSEQVAAAVQIGVPLIELNTAAYAEAVPKGLREHDASFRRRLDELQAMAELAASNNLRVLAGHGLTYRNVKPVSDIPQIEELNIGHNIVARATLVGIKQAVQEMLAAMMG